MDYLKSDSKWYFMIELKFIAIILLYANKKLSLWMQVSIHSKMYFVAKGYNVYWLITICEFLKNLANLAKKYKVQGCSKCLFQLYKNWI